MARQPKRSAFALTYNNFTTIRYRILLTIIVIFYTISSVRSNRNNDHGSSVHFTSSAQPKFGDRLLPRHRQIGTTSLSSANINNNNNNNNNQTATAINSANSFSVNNNYKIFENSIISNSNNNNNSDKILVPSVTDDVNNNKARNEYHTFISYDHISSDINENNENLRRSDIVHLSNDSINKNSDLTRIIADNNNYDNNNNAVTPVMNQRARSVQKLRRNDYDIEVDHDLVGGDHSIDQLSNHNNINVSKADRLIEMSTEFFIVPTSTTTTIKADNNNVGNQRSSSSSSNNNHHLYQQNQRQSTPRSVLILAPRTLPPTNITSSIVTPPTIISTTITNHITNGLRKEPWVVPVLVLASLCMIMMAAFEIFVLFKAWRTSPSRRHLFLGQMLLLGLFACAGLGAVLTATPTIVSCATIRFGVGVAYALVFAALLVKCVFLISLNGGVYLPAPYQGLLLLFAVLIQVAIGTQWLMTQPPDIQTLSVPITPELGGKFSMLITSTDIQRLHGSTVITLCKTQFSEMLLSLVYIFFLIVFVAILAIKSRGIRDNYREATYIGLAIGGTIPIWLGWSLCGLALTDRHKDACLAFGLVATSATVFLVMFMPKGRQLAAMGKEGLYVEDREEQFSSLSRAGSGYSPSFFHFKPIKYGVMGGIPNSATNTGNGTSSKHAATLGGDRVALVAAAPPSYTRMYHYFPAHMTHPFCFYPTPPPPPPPPPLSPPLPSPLKAAIGNHQQTPTTAQLAQTIRYPGLFMRPDETNLYTTLEPTLSSNPNVYFQRSGGVHPGMMY